MSPPSGPSGGAPGGAPGGFPAGLPAALERAFAAAGRSLPALRAAVPVTGGSINRAYRLETSEGPLFCKWNPGAPADLFRAEREGLEALRGAGTSLVIPRPLAWLDGGEGGAGPAEEGPLLVLEWLPPASPGAGDGPYAALGRGLAELHRAGADRFGFPRDNYCGITPQENAWGSDWAGFYGARRLDALTRRLAAAGQWGPREETVFRKLRDRLPALLGHGPRPSLIHGDLWSGNFLASARGPALIDPAAHFADREAEWGMLLLFGGFPPAVLDAYQESWPLPEGWRERVPLYQLYHVLNHWLLFGGSYAGRALRLASSLL